MSRQDFRLDSGNMYIDSDRINQNSAFTCLAEYKLGKCSKFIAGLPLFVRFL